ncbi:MAG: Rhamnan synthesis protein F RgpF [Treponematales bacterium]
MNRILLFVHYNKYDGLAEYVLYMLAHIKRLFSRIVFISNSTLTDEHKAKLGGLCAKIMERENSGFDFGAWKDALLEEGWDAVSQYNNVTLMNDTCFGPISDLEQIYINMEKLAIDFWGLTNHRNTKTSIFGIRETIPDHIQSYFYCFNRNVVSSIAFHQFWTNVMNLPDVKGVIQQYETQLTKYLSQEGFKFKVLLETSAIDSEHKNIAFRRPDIVTESNVPFLKIKSIASFPLANYIVQLLNIKTDYPIQLIYDHMNNIYSPNQTLLIQNKLVAAEERQNPITNLRVAVHFHVFYPDLLEQYISCLNNVPFNFDLFCTTDSEEKKSRIKNALQKLIAGGGSKEIVVLENRGRDILPWLLLSKKLNDYDVVGHFHTGKTSWAWIERSCLPDLLDLLLFPVNQIMALFESNDDIGIVIPEIPIYYHLAYQDKFYDNKNMKNMMKELWTKMNCKKELNIEQMLFTVFPYGSMFWYRPHALRPLFDLPLSAIDLTSEPLGEKDTILNAIERSVVYIAWNEDYDYRIMTPKMQCVSNFADNMVLNKHLEEYFRLYKNSRSYKLGRILLTIPRIIKRLLYGSEE